MRPVRLAIPLMVLTVSFSVSASGQKRVPKKPVIKKTSTGQKTIPPLDVRTAREKLEIQQENFRQFINKIGPIVQELEKPDLNAKVKAINDENRKNVVNAIRGLRPKLNEIELEFKAKTALRRYSMYVEGISALVDDAEDLAIAGRLVASKDPLREVERKLADALIALPK